MCLLPICLFAGTPAGTVDSTLDVSTLHDRLLSRLFSKVGLFSRVRDCFLPPPLVVIMACCSGWLYSTGSRMSVLKRFGVTCALFFAFRSATRMESSELLR